MLNLGTEGEYWNPVKNRVKYYKTETWDGGKESGIHHTGNHADDSLTTAEQWVNDRVLVGTITTDKCNSMRHGAQLG